MAAGGPFRGRGSPPEGDFYTEDDLREFARQTNEVIDEIDPFTKIGHNTSQILARRSGLYGEDDQPSTGRWRNFRVQGSGEAAKLVADVVGMPEKLARLFESGAFSKRSVEIKPYESQKGRGRFDKVIRAVALLGAKAPGIKTLDDVVALYGDDEVDDADLLVIEYADESGGPSVPLDLRVELELPPGSRENEDGADTTDGMPETTSTETGLTLTDEQRDALAQALGIEGDEVTADVLLARASEVRALADAAETGDGGEGGDGGGDGGEGGSGDPEPERVPAGGVMLSEADYLDLQSRADAGAEAWETLRVERRDRSIEDAIRDGRLTPGQRDEFVRLYDENEDLTSRVLETLSPNPDVAAAYGSEDDSQPTEDEQRLYEEFGAWAGIAPLSDGRAA